MNRLARLTATALLIGSTAACNNERGPTNQSAETENVAAPSNEMAMADDPTNPYARSEMEMHEKMMAATGANLSDTWARKMIEHHKGALDMSEVLLARDPNSRFADMARMTIKDQSAEIRELERMIQTGDPETQSR